MYIYTTLYTSFSVSTLSPCFIFSSSRCLSTPSRFSPLCPGIFTLSVLVTFSLHSPPRVGFRWPSRRDSSIDLGFSIPSLLFYISLSRLHFCLSLSVCFLSLPLSLGLPDSFPCLTFSRSLLGVSRNSVFLSLLDFSLSLCLSVSSRFLPLSPFSVSYHCHSVYL